MPGGHANTREVRKGKVRARDKVKAATTSGRRASVTYVRSRGRTRSSHGPHRLEGVCDSYVGTDHTPHEGAVVSWGEGTAGSGAPRRVSVPCPRQVLFSRGGLRDSRVFQRGVVIAGKRLWG